MIDRRIALPVVAALVTMLLIEAAARVWVAVRWPAEQAYQLTHLTKARGRFSAHPDLPYALTPGFEYDGFHHDELGFRGKAVPRKRTPGVPRIALLGASTVYAIYTKEGETAADRLREKLADRGLHAEIVNAGVPGWTSHETVVSMRERVLPMSPDFVVIMDGRNEAFPQLYRNFVSDYSHYRIPGYDVQATNRQWKQVFRWSFAAMVIVSRGELFGFSMRAEHPDYGSIRDANLPTPAEAERFALERSRFEPFEANIRAVIDIARRNNVVPVLAVIPFRPAGYGSGVLPGEAFVPAVTRAVKTNQAIVRHVAEEMGVLLVETEDLLRDELMRDDCHFNLEGEALLGQRYADVLEPMIRARQASH
jgi:lysophospholipase L1-like esterase